MKKSILSLLLLFLALFFGYSQSSDYCETEVRHLGIPAETASAIFLTITNVDPGTVLVEIESANDDPVDLLLIAGGSGAAISDEDTTVMGKISRTLSWGTAPDSVTLNVLWSKESFGGNWQLNPTDITIPFAASCPPDGPTQVDLPITFDDPDVDYALFDFAGAASQIITDPTDTTNTVAQTIKTDAAETFAGTTIDTNGLANPIPFTAENTRMSVRVWSPDAGIPVRLKVEDTSNPAISVETEDTTDLAMQWDTLVFNFANPSQGTPALDLGDTYDKATIFFNFGTSGADAGEKTYFWDDVQFLPASSTSEFCETEVKHLGIPAEDASAIFLTITNVDANSMLVEIESANDDPVDLLLVTGGSGAVISDEDTTVMGKISRTLSWMSPPDSVTLNVLWSKESFGGNWQVSPTDITVPFEASCPLPTPDQVDLPITFDDPDVDYGLVDFGGNASNIVADPEDTTNQVVETLRTDAAEVFAGTTAGGDGLASPIPFTGNDTRMALRVWSPAVDIPVRLKVEDATNAAISVETEVLTTVAMQWDTLEFDFAFPAEFSPPLDPANTYDKVSIFFNFGKTGAEAGAQTFYWDNVEFIGGGGLNLLDLPITFDDPMVNYTLVDFGGNASSIVPDPEDAANQVVESLRTDAAEVFAGTTAGANGLNEPIPFSNTDTRMAVRVWSPEADIPVRLKVEDASNGAISVETETVTTVAMQWDTLVFDFAFPVEGTPPLNLDNTYNKLAVFFNFGKTGAEAGAQTFYWDNVEFIGGGGLNLLDLPITFDDPDVTYTLQDFGGAASNVVADPTDATNQVVETLRTDAAEVFAGTTAGSNGLSAPIGFTMDNTTMTVRVWSPEEGIPVRVKVEDAANGAISVETEDTTTVAMQWDTLMFNFSNEVPGTPAINLANTYDKVSIFFNFGKTGAEAGAQTYYWDDVALSEGAAPGTPPDLPITFDDPDVDYGLADFGGNASNIVTDPTDDTNQVVESLRTDAAEVFAGTTAGVDGLANPIPFTGSDTRMSVRVWSPEAGIPVRVKVEDASDGAISVETEDTTTVAMQWDTLVFDFAMPVAGTPVLNLSNTYDKVSIFFNFGKTGAEAGAQTFFWDDVEFIGGGGMEEPLDLPITFDDPMVNYTLVDFGGNASVIVPDPEDATNQVVESLRTDAAEVFAGTTAGANGLTNPIPFTNADTRMAVRIWSPEADIPVRLKVEDISNAAISVETEVLTTVAMQWDTLVFDFASNVDGTPPLNLNNTYNKVSIFFNFGKTGAEAGAQTYYWDDVEFIGGGGLNLLDLPITFDDPDISYDLQDFGGNASNIVDDPTDNTNKVVESLRTDAAEIFAGTTAGANGLANPIGFTMDNTKMTVRVWSPEAGIPVRLKVEDASDGTISVETEDTTTVAMQWETLEFDFSNEVPGTPAFDLTNTYDKVSIFFNFGKTGAEAGAQTFYWDDVELFDPTVRVEAVPADESGINIFPNPVRDVVFISFDEPKAQPVQLQLFDASGKQLREQWLSDQQTALNVSGLMPGLYLIRLVDDRKHYTHRLIVK